MSQAEFGDSSLQENVQEYIYSSAPLSQSPLSNDKSSDEVQSQLSTLPRQVLEQELYFCNERSQQAQVLLRQAQEQLQLSQLVIQRQETLTQTLQSRIDQLERELQDVHGNCDELRDRLKRQQHHTSQLKAALERCLDTSGTVTNQNALSALESWSVAKLADEKISPVGVVPDSPLQNVVKITPMGDRRTTANEVTQDASAEQPELLTTLTTQDDPEPPTSNTISARNQPISPLIVRPHKAYQGSPLAIDLPKLQPDLTLGQHLTSSEMIAPQEQSMAEGAIEPQESNDGASSSAIAKSAVLNTVTAPKFMRSLYAHGQEQPEDDTDLAIAASSRKPTTLAAVQLPQFPPLPRR